MDPMVIACKLYTELIRTDLGCAAYDFLICLTIDTTSECYQQEKPGTIHNHCSSTGNKAHLKHVLPKRTRYNSKNASTVDRQLFSAESVALAVAKLNPGKAACFDGLQSEHLTYCHLIIYTVLARLFYFIMLHGYVPKDFACGMLVPIPK